MKHPVQLNKCPLGSRLATYAVKMAMKLGEQHRTRGYCQVGELEDGNPHVSDVGLNPPI